MPQGDGFGRGASAVRRTRSAGCPGSRAEALGRGRQTYVRRQPEQSVLHGVVREHLETFLAEARQRGGGEGLPGFVERELREFRGVHAAAQRVGHLPELSLVADGGSRRLLPAASLLLYRRHGSSDEGRSSIFSAPVQQGRMSPRRYAVAASAATKG